MNTFEFYRFRFHFRALDCLRFPAGKSANILRGAFGLLLRHHGPEGAYSRIFEPSHAGERLPSGLGDAPRPFVFRAAHLDGATAAPGAAVYFDLHVFDIRSPDVAALSSAFERLADEGLGPGRGRAVLERLEQLDLDGAVQPTGEAPLCLSLASPAEPARRVRLRFVTPTELKWGGGVVERPEFPALMGRLRDRIANLCALYGRGPLEMDYREMGERAAAVRLAACDLRWISGERKSSRTGQVHPLAGFTGDAEYTGSLGEFLPWLRAARWAGVGRQTVWGKGEVHVISPAGSDRAAGKGQ